MQRRSYTWRRLILAHPEYAAIRLRLSPGAAPGDKRARERGVQEIDRYGIIQHAACPRRGHRPTVSAAICVEPGGNLGMVLPQTARRDADPDADRATPLGHNDHFARVA